jgi:hypothetical protein
MTIPSIIRYRAISAYHKNMIALIGKSNTSSVVTNSVYTRTSTYAHVYVNLSVTDMKRMECI